MDGRDLEEVVVELSGVANPDSVRYNWEESSQVSLFIFLATHFTFRRTIQPPN